MATILASWELGRGYGHLAGLAPAARALGDLGHLTVLAAREPGTAERLPDRPFARVVQAPLLGDAPPPETTLTYGAVVRDGGFADPIAAERLVHAWIGLFDALKPDALLAEHAPASLLAAHVVGLPAARLGIGFTVPPPSRPFASLIPWEQVSEAQRLESDRAADAVVRDVCRALGAPPLDGLADLLSRVPPYLATWPELDIYGPRPGARYYGSMGGFGGAARPEWPAGAGPKVFVYVSIGHRLSGPLAEALGALGWPVLWHSVEPPPGLPANIAYSSEPIDMRYALESADLQVGRAGHASLCDGLSFGRSQLMLPDTLETLLLAGRLSHQKLGVYAVEDETSARLAERLEQLASDREVATASAAFRDRYAAYRPEAAAAELARDLLEGWGLGR